MDFIIVVKIEKKVMRFLIDLKPEQLFINSLIGPDPISN